MKVNLTNYAKNLIVLRKGNSVRTVEGVLQDKRRTVVIVLQAQIDGKAKQVLIYCENRKIAAKMLNVIRHDCNEEFCPDDMKIICDSDYDWFINDAFGEMMLINVMTKDKNWLQVRRIGRIPF